MSQAVHTAIAASGIEIAPLVLGGNVFGWTTDGPESFDVLDAFIAGGGDFIDTADGYSHWVPGHTGGESEVIIGEWLASRGVRDRVVIATKVFSHPSFKGLSPENVRAAADASLQRLGTDRIDLYYAHFDDVDVPLEQTVEAFSQLVDAGKVRAIGVSNYSAARVAEWARIASAGGFHAPVALQPHYNLVEREFETNGLRDVSAAEGLAVFPYFSLAKGFLAGKYRERVDASRAGASVRAEGAAQYLNPTGRAVLAALDEVAASRGVTAATVSLAWLRQQQAVTAPIASARTVEQLADLLASITLELGAPELEALSNASS